MGEYRDREEVLSDQAAESVRIEALARFMNEGFPRVAKNGQYGVLGESIEHARKRYYAAAAAAAEAVERIANRTGRVTVED